MSKSILMIGDTQCKPGVSLDYLTAVGEYLADVQPDVVVHIGDHWDFPSLSSYDKGKKEFEGRRVLEDIEAGRAGMEALLAPLQRLQRSQQRAKKKVYQPRMVFCVGNHEERFDRLASSMPELEGLVGVDTIGIEDFGWEVYPFLQPVDIDGIFFVHYLANPMTGRPYSGTAMNMLKTVGNSFACGHKQILDIAIRPTLDGKHQIGVVNGACYDHDEGYKGPQGNNHFRGVTLFTEVADGFALPSPTSLDYLMKHYL